MTKPKHQPQKTAAYARTREKLKRLHLAECGTVFATAFFMKSLFRFVTLRPSIFLAENTSGETDFSVGFTPSFLTVFCYAVGSPKRSLASAFTKYLAISLQN